jgi:transcription elongation GreA/GreB family factor
MNDDILKDKINVLKNDVERLNSMISQATSAAKEAQKEANYHIGAMQSRYDTFKEEAQYLAEAQKLRIFTLKDKAAQSEELISKLESKSLIENVIVNLGSLVCIEIEHDKKIYYFFVPDGTGKIVKIGQYQAVCISPEAPIAIPIIGCQIDDEIEFLFGGKNTFGIIDNIF